MDKEAAYAGLREMRRAIQDAERAPDLTRPPAA
jgi:hypothetical protein